MTFNAVILMALVFGLTEMAKSALPAQWAIIPWVKVVLTLIISVGGVLLVAQSAWAAKEFVGDQPLDKLNFASQALVGLLIAGGAAATQRTLKAVSNVGSNQPDSYTFRSAAQTWQREES